MRRCTRRHLAPTKTQTPARLKWDATSRRGREADSPVQHRTAYTCRQSRNGRRGVTGSIVAHVAAGRCPRTTQHHQSCLPQPAARHKHPRHHVNSKNTRQTLRALRRGAEQAMAGWTAARPRHVHAHLHTPRTWRCRASVPCDSATSTAHTPTHTVPWCGVVARLPQVPAQRAQHAQDTRRGHMHHAPYNHQDLIHGAADAQRAQRRPSATVLTVSPSCSRAPKRPTCCGGRLRRHVVCPTWQPPTQHATRRRTDAQARVRARTPHHVDIEERLRQALRPVEQYTGRAAAETAAASTCSARTRTRRTATLMARRQPAQRANHHDKCA
jgi:hypothetical protein